MKMKMKNDAAKYWRDVAYLRLVEIVALNDRLAKRDQCFALEKIADKLYRLKRELSKALDE